MKKLLGIICCWLLLSSVCFAYTPDPNEWQFVASDKENNLLYLNKTPTGFLVPPGDGSFTLLVDAICLMPNGYGSLYKELIHHSVKMQQNLVCHAKIWSFKGNPANKLTAGWGTPPKRVWHSTQDPWYAAEYNYAVQRANAMGWRYR